MFLCLNLFFYKITQGESPNAISKEKEKISMLASDKLNLAAQKFSPVELYWENITVVAKLKTRKYRLIPCIYEKSTKVILDECTGIARPGTFTAILGPSGLNIFSSIICFIVIL